MKKQVLLILCCLIGCGIERATPILKPPVAGSAAESSDIFIFYNAIEDVKNIKYVKGIEIYYKFYNTIEEANADYNIISYSTLITNKFWRVNRYTDNERITKPLIDIPEENKTGISKFTIDFTSLTHVYISAVPESGSSGVSFTDFPIYRGVLDENQVYKDFSSIKAGDADIASIKDLTKEIYLAIYVFSYGVFELSPELYSAPVWLNKIQLLY